MPISYVANSAAYQNRNGADPATIACGVNVTVGNLICVGICWKDAGGVAEINSVTDTVGSTYSWTNLNVNSDGLTVVLAWAEAAGSGANTVTIDFTGPQSVCDLTVCEFAGFADAPALAAYKTIISNADPLASGNTGTPGATDCVAVAIGEGVTLHFDANFDPWSPSGGVGVYTGATDYFLAYKILSSDTAQAVADTVDGSGYWGIVIGIFKNQSAAAVIDQEGVRFRNDDGDEAGASWAADQDANITAPLDQNLRVRFLVNTTNDLPVTQFQLEAKLSTESGYWKVD